MAKYESKKILNLLGFIATSLIAIAILVAGIVTWILQGHFTMQIPGLSFSSGVPAALVCIANIIAYFICIVVGFLYARSKRNMAFMIIHVVACIIIMAVVILNIFGV